jgi:hypothetical protein
LARFLNRKNNSLAAVKNRANPSGQDSYFLPMAIIPLLFAHGKHRLLRKRSE